MCSKERGIFIMVGPASSSLSVAVTVCLLLGSTFLWFFFCFVFLIKYSKEVESYVLGGRWGCFPPDFDTCQARYFTVLRFNCLMYKMAIKKITSKQANKPLFLLLHLLLFFHFLPPSPSPPLFPPSCVRVHKTVNVKYLTFSTEYVYGKIHYCICFIIVIFLIIAMDLFLL